MLSLWMSLLVLLPLGAGVEVLAKRREGLLEEVQGRQLGAMLGQVVKRNLAGCHLVLATTQRTPVFTYLLRHLAADVEAGVVAEVGGSLLPQDQPGQALRDQESDPTGQGEQELLLKGLWGKASSTCHALLLDNTSGRSTSSSSLFRFVERCGLWLRPEVRVVVLGVRSEAEPFLLHPALRNSLNAVYLAHHVLPPPSGTSNETTLKASDRVEVYRRCLYCQGGEPAVQLLHTWPMGSGLPKDLSSLFFDKKYPEVFHGHEFQIVDKNYFPYFSFERSSDVPGSRVYPRDSLITRMLDTIVPKLNFTHFIREPLDGQWGVPGEGGNWTGIIGELQHQLGDLALDLTVTSQRATVADFTRIFIDEPVAILSSKPRPLPEYLSLMRPFEGMLWLFLLVSIVVWGVTLWLLQRAWSRASGGRGLSISSALFYSWSVMLEDPPTKPPKNVSAQVLVGWWLVFCLVVATAYRSSLISHLVVQGKSPLINSAEDLVSRKGWKWGTPRMTGALLSFLRSSPNPAILKMYHGMQADSIDQGMKLVLRGGYSFVYNKYYARSLIATRFTDDVGYTPIHISATEYPLFAGDAWACRRGAPFRRRLDLTIQRLVEAGLVTFWMDDVIATHVRNNRQKRQESSGDEEIIYQRDDDQVVLGLHHLQVTFYILFLSYSLSFFVFLAEKFLY